MERDRLLELGAELGYRLMVSGAEIHRTEDSVGRLFRAYGLEGEVFAIPNCFIASLSGPEGPPVTCIRRIPVHGTSVELLERYNALCRELCRETPDVETAMERLRAVPQGRPVYPMWAMVPAYFAGAAFFCLMFGGSLADALCSGLCGAVGGLFLRFMSRVSSNIFFRTIAASALSAVLALLSVRIWTVSLDTVISGAYMAYLPGVAFTTALRDIMAGDMISGLAKAAEGILIAVAIALATAAALALSRALWGG